MDVFLIVVRRFKSLNEHHQAIILFSEAKASLCDFQARVAQVSKVDCTATETREAIANL